VHVSFDETKFPSPIRSESEEPDVEMEVLTPNTHLRRARDIGGITEIGPGEPGEGLPGGEPTEPVGDAQRERIPILPKGKKLTDHIAFAVGDLMGYPTSFREASEITG
jgi:hypothetical protein